MSEKIKMNVPIVEMDGDEMTRVIWAWVKEILIEPFVELKTEYYDLGLGERERTKDGVTVEAAEAIKKHGVGVKCATITPNDERVKEYGLTDMYKSPNGTIRAILDGTVFRAPILAKGIVPYIPNWKKPITIARHAYGDIYRNVECRAEAGAKVELVVTASDGSCERMLVHSFGGDAGGGVGGTVDVGAEGAVGGDVLGGAGGGIAQGVHNTDASIASFARACMNYALDTKQELWFATKDTISKTYDRRFRDIFQGIFEDEYKDRFKDAGVSYFYTLIDDVVARVVRSDGGFIWACKNYDGDVMSDMVASAFGSLAMMTSVLVSPDGFYEYEAAHGTVQRHYYKHVAGEATSTNSVATVFAWTGALKKRAELDGLPKLAGFGERLEQAVLETIGDGVMTGDLVELSVLENKRKVGTEEFLREVADRV
ncbi:MAG: NADP-dependent isocitrate dehydrogenase [Clostridiales bacterium]|nr:NADP-dependent isocitrate dehydrogenase [Clostridiales bacterium]